MLRVYDCIVHQHDVRLVVLATLLALLGALTTIRLLLHVAALPAGGRRVWLGAASLAAGCAIWATHFVAVLAYQPGVPVTYTVAPTLLSLVVAVLATAAGLTLALRRDDRWTRALGGVVVGLGIATMHYLGMSALQVPGYLAWDPAFVPGSVAAGSALGAAALIAALDRTRPWHGALGAALFALAICAVHFTGMAAVSIHLMNAPVGDRDTVSSGLLAFNIAFVCGVILILGLAGLELDRRHALRSAAAKAALHVLADIAAEGLVVCDGDRVVAVNGSFEQMTGRRGTALKGTHVEALFDTSAASPRMAMPLGRAGERLLIAADGATVPVEVTRKPILYDGRPHQVVAFRDLRERRKAEEEICFLAHHDALTGLSNRTAFGIELRRQLGEQTRDTRPFALLGVDLDRFKAVNEMLGHSLGDKLLKQVAHRLRAAVRAGDVVARIGGDEFSILLAGPMTAESAAVLASRVVEMIRRPFIVDGEVVSIGSSVGVALAPPDSNDAISLMTCADLALCRAKADGGNTVRFFESGADTLVRKRRIVELDLRRALRQEELVVYYQPLFDLRSGSVHGFEALVRWRHPERGLLLPGEFIGVAEETGLIMPLGAFVLTAACRQAAAWGRDVSIAVNLSAVQFLDGKLVGTVQTALLQSGLEPCRLELEITESVPLRDSEATLAILHELRRLGVRISMDDFGTGYSSLRYLRTFPFDKIKIDQSFVQEMLSNPESAAIIDAVIGIGRRLGIAITAEGVETEAQMARLRDTGCDMLQGYLIGRPEPAAGAMSHLDTTSRREEFQIDASASQSPA